MNIEHENKDLIVSYWAALSTYMEFVHISLLDKLIGTTLECKLTESEYKIIVTLMINISNTRIDLREAMHGCLLSISLLSVCAFEIKLQILKELTKECTNGVIFLQQCGYKFTQIIENVKNNSESESYIFLEYLVLSV